MRSLSPLFMAVVSGLLPAQTTAPVHIDATVCDPDGRPLAGARFGDSWSMQAGKWVPGFICPNPPLVLTSDAEGRMRGTWTWSPMATPLLGLSADGRFAAFVQPMPDSRTNELRVPARITLHAAVRLRGRIRTTAAAMPPSWAIVRWSATDAGLGDSWFTFGLDQAAFELPLPPQRYEFSVCSTHGRSPSRTVVLAPGRSELDLGPITVQLGAFGLIGELLPDWHVDMAWHPGGPPPTTASALVGTTLAELRGKPLLVHFGASPSGGLLPEARASLANLAQHPGRKGFQVVLFDTSPVVGSWDERSAQPALETLFPRFHDSTHRTEALYGAAWATILLDADGRLLHCGAVDDTVAALQRLLDAARPR